MKVCKYCGKEYSDRGIGTHIWRSHGEGKNHNPNIGYENGSRVVWNKGLTKINDCRIKQQSETLKNNIKSGKIIPSMLGKHLNMGTKKKLSNSMKNCHKEGRHPGWLHVNGDKSRRSYPEKFILKVLKSNGLFEKYTIIEKLPISKYFLDFAIIDIKLDIEVDGEQHYRTDEAILHDKIRNEFLINKGWKIYRINWREFNYNTKIHIKKLLEFIDDIQNRTNHFYDISEVTLTKRRKYGNRNDYSVAMKEKYDLSQQPKIKILLESDINFNKFGWVNEASKILNIHHGRVNIWMKRFLPEFYDEKCFKRRAPVYPPATNRVKG